MPPVPELADPRLVLDDATQQLIVTVTLPNEAEARIYAARCRRLRSLDLGKAETRARAGEGPIPPEIEALRALLIRLDGREVQVINCAHKSASELFPKFKIERK